MNQAQILSDLQILVGEVAPGSLAFTSDQYAAALQWAQEQASRLLGLTYQEEIMPTYSTVGPWGESLTTVDIPTDAIKVTRCELAAAVPPANFTIAVAPADSIIQFDEGGDQIGALVLSVTITRLAGYISPITISSPVFTATADFPGEFNGNTYASQTSSPETIPNVEDSNVLTISTTLTGWNEVASNWASAVINGVGDDGSTAVSNEFSVTEPAGPYITIDVEPDTIYWLSTQPPTPMTFTATITPHDGYNDVVTVVLPTVQATVGPDGGADEEINITLDGVPVVVGTPGVSVSGILVADTPTTIPIVLTVGYKAPKLTDPMYRHMQLTVFGSDSTYYVGNQFGINTGS